MIICQCAGVTDSTIAKLVEEGVTNIGDVVRLSGAGRCCPPCRAEIASMIELLSGRPAESPTPDPSGTSRSSLAAP